MNLEKNKNKKYSFLIKKPTHTHEKIKISRNFSAIQIKSSIVCEIKNG